MYYNVSNSLHFLKLEFGELVPFNYTDLSSIWNFMKYEFCFDYEDEKRKNFNLFHEIKNQSPNVGKYFLIVRIRNTELLNLCNCSFAIPPHTTNIEIIFW